jgi:hypothetical protein
MRVKWSSILAAALLAPASRAFEEEGPAAAPARAEVRQWIAQLGDDDYAARNAAARRLRAAGRSVLPALKRVSESNGDPELATRARVLVGRIETRPIPGGDPSLDPAEFAEPMAIKDISIDGDHVLEVAEFGRQTHIAEGNDGIEMTVTGLLDGEQVTEDYAATSPADLRRKSPQAFGLFQRLGGGNAVAGGGGGANNPAVAIARRGGVRIVGGGAFAINAAGGGMFVAGPDELDVLRYRLDKQMRAADADAGTKAEIRREIGKLAEARGANAPSNEAYVRQCDAFRETAERHKLVVGNLLPPPAKSRLGISVSADLAGRVLVNVVAPDSRGARLGLRSDDVILSMDGKPVATVGDLRDAAAANERGLVVEVVREDKPVKLVEGDPKAAAAEGK